VCGIAIFGEAHATKHATQTKHLQFEEYIPKPGEEIVAPPPEKSSMTEEEKLAKIEELRKRNEMARQQKQVQQEKDQFDKEKKRRQDAKESEAARQKWKEDQERKLIEEQKREKAEEAKYKEDLKRKIAEDKLKREQELKGTPAPVPQQQTAIPQSVSKKAEYDKCNITFRLTNGNRIEGEFQPLDTLKTVFEFVEKKRTDGNRPFSLIMTHPKKTFTSDQFDLTLLAAELVPRAMLIVTPK